MDFGYHTDGQKHIKIKSRKPKSKISHRLLTIWFKTCRWSSLV